MRRSLRCLLIVVGVAQLAAPTARTQERDDPVWNLRSPSAPRADTGIVRPRSRHDDSLPAPEDLSLRRYLWQAIGPVALLRAAALGGIDEARDQPREWSLGAHGYAQRAGSHLAAAAIGTGVRFGLDALLHQQSGGFVPCSCDGSPLRLRHAALVPLRAYGPRGWAPSPLVPLTRIVSALLVTTVRPGGFNVRDGLRAGAMSVASLSAVSVVHEFWPWPWSLGERWRRRLPRALQGASSLDSSRTGATTISAKTRMR